MDKTVENNTENTCIPKVSILMPVYKVEKYLRQCLDSVINQTLNDIEIVIVDEGDFDECRAIIDEYEAKDTKIKTIHEKNGSYGVALNKALKIATGEYIGIVETDDFIKPEMFNDLYNLAKKFDADIVKSDWLLYYSKNNKSIKAGVISPDKTNRILNAKEDNSILKIPPSIWSAIYKRELLEKNNIKFVEKLHHSYQDTSFTFKVYSLADKVVLSDKPYVYYRQDNENSSCNTNGNIYAICDEYNEINKFLDEHKEIKNILNSRKLINEYNGYVWNFSRISNAYRLEFTKKNSEIFGNYYDNNEINETFFSEVKRKHFKLLIDNPEKFVDIFNKKLFFKKFNDLRKKIISIKIKPSKISISIFGKTIVGVK